MEYQAGNTDTTFESVQADQMVVVRGMRVWSICEHHLLPFWCDVTIGYITHDMVVGLSKFARIAHKHAHRLQLQERLVNSIADDVQRLAFPRFVNDHHKSVAVVGQGVHLCMVMRGIQTEGTMVSSITRGMFRTDDRARNEFLRLAGL
jgi:GTP cyclohydrolase I